AGAAADVRRGGDRVGGVGGAAGRRPIDRGGGASAAGCAEPSVPGVATCRARAGARRGRARRCLPGGGRPGEPLAQPRGAGRAWLLVADPGRAAALATAVARAAGGGAARPRAGGGAGGRRAGVHVVGPALAVGVLLGAALWALAAVLLPLVVRGRSAALDVLAATLWSAVIVAAAPALDSGGPLGGAHASGRGAILGAVFGA